VGIVLGGSGDYYTIMIRLILIRHGETNKNAGNKLHGYADAEKLNAVGRKQIAKTAKELAKYLPVQVYSSSEKRAVESAQIIAKALKIPLKKIEGMEERNWGIYAGKAWDEVKNKLDQMSLEERYTYLPPEGESWKQFEERLINAIQRIVQENQGTVVVVTHGGAIRALLPYLLGVNKEESFKYDPPNGSLTIFEYQDGVFTKVLVCGVEHLED